MSNLSRVCCMIARWIGKLTFIRNAFVRRSSAHNLEDGMEMINVCKLLTAPHCTYLIAYRFTFLFPFNLFCICNGRLIRRRSTKRPPRTETSYLRYDFRSVTFLFRCTTIIAGANAERTFRTLSFSFLSVIVNWWAWIGLDSSRYSGSGFINFFLTSLANVISSFSGPMFKLHRRKKIQTSSI